MPVGKSQSCGRSAGDMCTTAGHWMGGTQRTPVGHGSHFVGTSDGGDTTDGRVVVVVLVLVGSVAARPPTREWRPWRTNKNTKHHVDHLDIITSSMERTKKKLRKKYVLRQDMRPARARQL